MLKYIREIGDDVISQIKHYNGVTMSAKASKVTGISIVCSTVGSGTDQRKHQSSASLAFVRGIVCCGVDVCNIDIFIVCFDLSLMCQNVSK